MNPTTPIGEPPQNNSNLAINLSLFNAIISIMSLNDAVYSSSDDESVKSTKKINDNSKIYNMQPPCFRRVVIQQIDATEIESECKMGKKNKWWKTKHHPGRQIPTNIYLLGRGTLPELHAAYIAEYGEITKREFLNYTRELIKQGIMFEDLSG